jgi:hypothetical protein
MADPSVAIPSSAGIEVAFKRKNIRPTRLDLRPRAPPLPVRRRNRLPSAHSFPCPPPMACQRVLTAHYGSRTDEIGAIGRAGKDSVSTRAARRLVRWRTLRSLPLRRGPSPLLRAGRLLATVGEGRAGRVGRSSEGTCRCASRQPETRRRRSKSLTSPMDGAGPNCWTNWGR